MLRVKITFFVAYGLSAFFGLLVVGHELSWISANWILLFIPPSDHPEGSKEDHDYKLGYIVPILVFFLKVGINIGFLATYRASFNEDFIFPFNKRATAIGICNFIARLITALSPLVAELDRPGPIAVVIILNVLAFLTSF